MNIEKIDLVDADHVAAGTAAFLASEAKQPAQPGELTREWLDALFAYYNLEIYMEMRDELWSRILSDRSATEARVRAEEQESVLRWMDEVDSLRTTIADLERKIEHLEIIKEEVEAATEADIDSEGSCVWSEDSDGNWNTSCKQMFCLNDGTPKDNDMKYCTYCGKPLHQNLFEYES